MHERCLHIDAEDDAEPNQVDTEFFRGWSQERYDDESQLKKVEEEHQQKDQNVGEDEKADRPPGRDVNRCSTQTWPFTP